ncbi:hypothetical protein [Archangium sp.]|jgi:hypothetical protein|uniref:hypothetical protein n=1 Tax=Archangium sp. TaxID=1872627 RepID=UPI002EDA747C
MQNPSSLPEVPKVGFLVGDDLDKLLVETLGRKVVEQSGGLPQPRFSTIRVYGSPQVRYIYPEIATLVERGCRRVIVVFDTETIEGEPATLLRELQKGLVEWGLLERVDLMPVTPSTAGWILADREAVEQVAGAPLLEECLPRGAGPREELEAWLGGEKHHLQEKLGEVVTRLSPERIRARNTDGSFARFEECLLAAIRLQVERGLAEGPSVS